MGGQAGDGSRVGSRGDRIRRSRRNLTMSARNKFEPGDLPPLTDAQNFALELRWYEGKMFRYVDLLTGFAARHRNEILREAGDARDTDALCAATQRCIPIPIVRQRHRANNVPQYALRNSNRLAAYI